VNRFDLVFSSKVNSETLQGQRQGMHHFAVPPDAYLHDLFSGVWSQVNVDFFVEFRIGDFDGVVEE
jgi:hypothetical protein